MSNCRLTVTVQDGRGGQTTGSLVFTWTANTGSLAAAQNTASTSRVVWTAPSCAPPGVTPSVTAVVTNAFGLSVSKPFPLSGLPACVTYLMTCVYP